MRDVESIGQALVRRPGHDQEGQATMELFVPAVALLALINKFTDFSKYITNRDVNGALTQLYVWIVGIAAVALYAQTAWADTISFADVALSHMNFATQAAIGVALASGASVVKDVIKSLDKSDSAAMPPLLPEVAKAA